MKKFFLVIFTLSLCIGVNLPDSLLAQYGIDPNVLMMAMIAFLIAGLLSHANIALVFVIMLLTLAVNLPAEFADSVGYNPNMLLIALIAMVILPVTVKQL